MNTRSSYEKYLDSLVSIVVQLQEESASQSSIAKTERATITEIDRKYSKQISILQNAEKSARDQYANVWEACTTIEGLKKPRDQRSLYTDMTWEAAISEQDKAASRIRDWLARKAQAARIEREKRIREEKEREAAMLLSQAAEAQKKAEAEARAEEKRSEDLIESMKRKYRHY